MNLRDLLIPKANETMTKGYKQLVPKFTAKLEKNLMRLKSTTKFAEDLMRETIKTQ